MHNMRSVNDLLQLADCDACPLACKPVHGRGNKTADIVIVGDAPSRQDTAEDRVFSKSSGMLMAATVENVGGESGSVYYTNAVLCRPNVVDGVEQAVPRAAVKACSKRLAAEVKSVGPRVVIASGSQVVKDLCETTRPLSKIQGAMHWNENIDSFVIPTYSAGAVLAGAKDSINIFDDIYRAIDRAVLISHGELALPDKTGQNIKWEFVGHDGEKVPRGEFFTWTGYWDPPTDDEKTRALQIVNGWVQDLHHSKLTLALDTESRDLDFFNPMTMIQLYDGDTAYAFTWGVLSDEVVARALHSVLMNPRTHVIMHNLSHDRKVLKYHLGLDFGDRDEDTMAWGLGLTEKGKEVGLKYLSRQYLNAPYYEEELEKYFDPDNDPWDTCPPSVLAEYGCADVFNTYKLGVILPKLVEREGTTELVKGHLTTTARTFADCEYRGIGVDTAYAKELEEQWIPLVDQAEQRIKDYAKSVGFPFNITVCSSQKTAVPCPVCTLDLFTTNSDSFLTIPRADWRSVRTRLTNQDTSCSKCSRRRYIMLQNNEINVRSPKQLAHLAYDILGFREGKQGRTTDKGFMTRNAGHEFVNMVSEFRQRDKLLNSFVRAIQKHVKQDGRIHPSFLLFGAVTGRPSIKDPAMQTIPKFGTDRVAAKMIRRLFPARPGHVIVDADYANLELFTCWAYSEDPELGKALTESDYHAVVAATVLGIPYDQVTEEQRNAFKPLTFGISYGMTAWKMAQTVLKKQSGGSEDVCQQYIDDMWAKFPKWKKTYDKWISDALEHGELTSMIGRKRRWKLINNTNEWHVRNQASNFPSQSLASDLCLNSLNILNKELPALGYGNVLFPVHDSIVSEVRIDKLHEAVALIERVMTTPPFESVAEFRVKVEVGPTLGDVEAYDPDKVYA